MLIINVIIDWKFYFVEGRWKNMRKISRKNKSFKFSLLLTLSDFIAHRPFTTNFGEVSDIVIH